MDFIFESRRLIFRHWKESDKADFQKMNSDPAVMEFFPKMLASAESDTLADKIIIHLKKYNYGLWAVETKEENGFIGFIGFNNTLFEADFTPCIEIGWRLKKEAWGKGLATEGARRCLEYGFETLGFTTVYSFTAVLNERSSNVMKKIGMEQAGYFNHPNIAIDNRLNKHVLYKITKDNYKK